MKTSPNPLFGSIKTSSGVASGSTTITHSTLGGSTAYIAQWQTPIFLKSMEVDESIEFLYKEISNCVTLQYPPSPPYERVFKIVYSCKDGKWHKSEPIYGTIVPSQDEYYEFEE